MMLAIWNLWVNFCVLSCSFVVLATCCAFLKLQFSDCNLGLSLRSLPSDAFRDKVVWVTGASSGIGEALVHALSEQGSQIIISSRRADELERVKKQSIHPGNIMVLPLDLEDVEVLSDKVQEVLHKYGHVDVMIHCAGVATRAVSWETTWSLVERMMSLNYFGQVRMTQELLKSMRKRKSGLFVNVSSVSGIMGFALRAVYSGSKAALFHYMDAIACENEQYGIHTVNVCPALVNSNGAKNALLADGTPTGQQIGGSPEQGLSPQRVAYLTLVAAAHRLPEVWIANQPTLSLVYMRRYLSDYYYSKVRGSIGKRIIDGFMKETRSKRD